MLTHLDMRRLCQRCGGEIPAHKRPTALFCSKACTQADYLETERQGRLDDKRNRPPCKRCGAPIPPEARAGRVFCCEECQRVFRYRANIEARPMRTCETCGDQFRPTILVQRWCSPACAHEAHRGSERACDQCGGTIPRPWPRQRFCGPPCRNLWHNRKARAGRT